MKKLLASLLMLIPAALSASTPTMTPAGGYPDFALGADISWTPYIERNNIHTYYKEMSVNSGVTNIEDMVSDFGIDAVRLRVWVDPTSEKALSGFSFKAWGSNHTVMSTFGTCTVEEMTTLARRFAMRGQRVMVSFQMSDVWADPGAQFIPQSWADCSSVDELAERAANHVTEVLTILRDLNVNVAWVQIGNEVNNGMLAWEIPQSGGAVSNAPYGCAIAWDSKHNPEQTVYNFVKVFKACAEAANDVYPRASRVLQLAKGDDWGSVNWSLGLLVSVGLSKEMCDYIGFSLYPGIDSDRQDATALWKEYADKGIENIGKVHDVYGFRTILCEIGMNNEYSTSISLSGMPASEVQGACIEQCNKDVAAFTQYLIDNLATAESTCDGLFYWEPETDYMKDYKRGACVSVNPGASWPRDKVTANAWWHTIKDNSTFPSGGLVEYSATDGIASPVTGDYRDDTVYYNLQGIRIERPSRGICIECRQTSARIVVF